ncbi:Putrescine importer PuuP [Pseudomonas sp. 25 R 14]|nr:Putrescine importer PuuP [Pseudomonas sp. 25 R 14]
MAPLKRTLSLGAVVLFGIAYMAPIIVLATFGILADITKGGVPAAYLVASLAMLFTALSYARMAAEFPVAGSAYSYVRKCISPNVGFLAGWVVLLDYLFLPMVICLFGATFLHAAGGFNRSSQHLDRGVYGTTRRMDAKIDGPGSDAFSRCTLTS